MQATKNDQSRQRIEWFNHDRFGMFIHWGLYSILARGEWVRSKEQISGRDYQQYFEEFNPLRYDPRSWARIARQAGQQYAVLTAKHHEGFCLFDSKLTGFNATRTPAKRDLVREYVDAFRKEGLKVGFYYSLLDWHHPGYPVDRLHPLRDDKVAKARKRDLKLYVDYLHGQVHELLTNYGRIDVIWFDFSYDKMTDEAWRAMELMDMVRKLQPDIVVNNRLTAGHCNLQSGLRLGDFATPEQIVPPNGLADGTGKAIPWEACITLNDNWGYAYSKYKTAQDVIRMLVECVSKGGNLLLNVGPNPRGEIPVESVKILEEVGRWMRENSESIYGCGAAGLPKPEWGRFTSNGNRLYAHVFERPMGPVVLPNMRGKICKARLLRDGSEVRIQQPWNAADYQEDEFICLTDNVFPDPIDTVVMLELK